MTTSTEQLNDAIAALQRAADAYNGKKAEIDAALAASQAGYNALAANLKSVVASQMHFTATIDPDVVDPDEVDGGTFNSISDAVDAAPRGADIVCTLVSGKTHVLGRPARSYGSRLTITSDGLGVAPVLRPAVYSTGTHNAFHGFYGYLGLVRFADLEIDLALDKIDEGLPWNGALQSLIYAQKGGRIELSMDNCTVVGADSASLALSLNGVTVVASMANTSLDGNMYAVTNGSQGVAIISDYNVTLLNGAQLTNTHTLGQNLLNN